MTASLRERNRYADREEKATWRQPEKTIDMKAEAEGGAVCLQAEGRPPPPKAGRGREGSPQSPRRERSPADSLLLDFWLPDCERMHLLLLKATRCSALSL